MTGKTKSALMIILLLASYLRVSPARAEFNTAFIAVGIIIGIGMAEISHKNDNENNHGDKDDKSKPQN